MYPTLHRGQVVIDLLGSYGLPFALSPSTKLSDVALYVDETCYDHDKLDRSIMMEAKLDRYTSYVDQIFLIWNDDTPHSIWSRIKQGRYFSRWRPHRVCPPAAMNDRNVFFDKEVWSKWDRK